MLSFALGDIFLPVEELKIDGPSNNPPERKAAVL
jgi:hypothetical protein